MKLYTTLTLGLMFIGLNAFSARVAVTDSGTDFAHDWLVGRALINTNEVVGNRVDDDHNGKVDDIVGWNFADNYGKVFFKEHVSEVSPQVYIIMDILSRKELGTTTAADNKYWKENITDLKKEEKQKLVNSINAFGQYAHSTHVSGIIASVSPNSKIMSNRVFPDTPLASFNPFASPGISSLFYKVIATITNGSFEAAAKYIAERRIDVANYSLGVPLQTIAKLLLGLKGVKEPPAPQIKPGEKEPPKPTPEQIEAARVYAEAVAKEAATAYAQYEPLGKKWLQSAPQTFFVIAAGNDGADNDSLPSFPGNIEVDNSITIAASENVSSLAKFSNFGIKSVDLAAPGVAIKSSVPSMDNKAVLPFSGTSMAAPYVTGVAANMKDINPQLTPAQLKLILMGTVDKKSWLATKVVSGGVVNPDRAYDACARSKSMTIESAIAAAVTSVADQIEPEKPKKISRVTETSIDMNDFSKQLVF